MKQVIRLTESDLHKMVKEAINEINNVDDDNESYTENYTHFAVNKNNGLIVNGWDYSEYDSDELRQFKKDYFFDDLMDNDFNPKDYKILTRKGCERQGINPDDIDNCWSNAGEIPCSQERIIHKNKYVYNNN